MTRMESYNIGGPIEIMAYRCGMSKPGYYRWMRSRGLPAYRRGFKPRVKHVNEYTPAAKQFEVLFNRYADGGQLKSFSDISNMLEHCNEYGDWMGDLQNNEWEGK